MNEVDLVHEHRRLTARRVAIVVGLCVVAAAAFVMSNMVGAISLTPSQVIGGIMVPSSLDEQTHTVLWDLRLPMAVMALLIGVSLSLAGAEMQTILGNPLAEPFTLGISAGAAFGGATTTVAFAGIIGFVGLVGPHIARMLVGEDQRYFIPASMASGAALMCCAHAVSLMAKPGLAIPIGIVTSLLGVPFFLGIVLTRRRALWS